MYTHKHTHLQLHFSEGDTSHTQLIMSHLQNACRLSLNHITVSPKYQRFMPAHHRVVSGSSQNKNNIQLQHYWLTHIYSATMYDKLAKISHGQPWAEFLWFAQSCFQPHSQNGRKFQTQIFMWMLLQLNSHTNIEHWCKVLNLFCDVQWSDSAIDILIHRACIKIGTKNWCLVTFCSYMCCVDFPIKSQCILSIIMYTDDSPSAPAWSDPHSLQLVLPLPLRLHLHEPPWCWPSQCLHPCDWDQKMKRHHGWHTAGPQVSWEVLNI